MSGAQEKVNILLIVADSGKEAVGRLPPFLAPPHRCNLCTKLCICAIVCAILLFAPSTELCICTILHIVHNCALCTMCAVVHLCDFVHNGALCAM